MAATLEGELSFARVPALYAQADALAQASPLDLSRVTRADSAGLALLLELNRRAQARGIELRLSGAPQQVTALATFFGLGAVLRFDA
jgi:phospholipid transport system transporter-binding protein